MMHGGRLSLTITVVVVSLITIVVGDPIPLGLDLRGGALLTYRPELEAGDDAEAMGERTIPIIRRRLDDWPNELVLLRSGNQIRIELEDADEQAVRRVRTLLERMVQLRFLAVDEEMPLPKSPPPGIEERVEPHNSGPTNRDAAQRTFYWGSDRERLTAHLKTLPTPKDREWAVGEDPSASGFRSYLLHRRGAVSGTNIKSAEVTMEHQRPAVLFRFDEAGRKQFALLTEKQRDKRIAILLDGVVYSAPLVHDPIANGEVQIWLRSGIAGQEALKEAQELVQVLRSGALPRPLVLTNEQIIHPAVSASTIGVFAVGAVFLFLLVALFALLRYRLGGLAILFGVPLSMIMSVALFVLFQAVCTAPSLIGLASGLLVQIIVTIYLLVLAQRKRPIWLVPATLLALNFVASAILFHVAHGPIRGLAFGFVISSLTAAFSTLVLGTVIAEWAQKMRPVFPRGADPSIP